MDFTSMLGLDKEDKPQEAAISTPEGWMEEPPKESKSLFSKAQSDPAFTTAMLMTGARLMQGTRPGQDQIGMLGDAIATGTLAYNFQLQNQNEENRSNEIASSQSAQRAAATEAQRESTQQSREDRPSRVELLKAQVEAARLAGDTAAQESAVKKLKLIEEAEALKNPALAEERKAQRFYEAAKYKRDQALHEAALGQARASTTASISAAGLSSANAELIRAKTADPGRFNQGAGGGPTADMRNFEFMAGKMKAMYPEATEAEIVQKVMDCTKTAKTSSESDAFLKFAMENDYANRSAEEQAQLRDTFQQLRGSATGLGSSAPAPTPATAASALQVERMTVAEYDSVMRRNRQMQKPLPLDELNRRLITLGKLPPAGAGSNFESPLNIQ